MNLVRSCRALGDDGESAMASPDPRTGRRGSHSGLPLVLPRCPHGRLERISTRIDPRRSNLRSTGESRASDPGHRIREFRLTKSARAADPVASLVRHSRYGPDHELYGIAST